MDCRITLLTIDSDNGSWLMRFKICSGELIFTFDVDEPQLHSLDEWRNLANGSCGLSFYQGDGEGSIEIEDNKLIFTAWPSGSGGDVVSQVRVPIAAVSSQLHAALSDAIERGYKFK